MNILFLCQGTADDQSVKHRMIWPAEVLETRGHDCTVCTGVKQNIRGRNLRFVSPRHVLKSAQNKYDAVVMNRDGSPVARIAYSLTELRNTSLIFDFCDALYTRQKVFETSIPNPTRIWFEWLVRNSDFVTTGSQSLAEYACDLNFNVLYNPTPVNTDIFIPDSESPREYENIVIGWMGSGPDHKPNLELLVEPLQQISKEFDITLRIVSALSETVEDVFAELEDMADIEYGFDEWRPIEDIVAEMQTFDIAVCPLAGDDSYMTGKSSMKVLECLATKTPVVASNHGPYGNLIEHGETGLLASNTEEWVNHISELISQPNLRSRLANNGYQAVMDNYTVEHHANRLETVIESSISED